MTLYFSNMNAVLSPLIEFNKSVVFINDIIFFAIISDFNNFDSSSLKNILIEDLQRKSKQELVKARSK